MPFSAEEIENKEFLTTLRGYDRHEVNAFLFAVAADYRALEAELGRAERDGPSEDGPRGGGNPYDLVGQEVGNVLQVARESANSLWREAEEDAASVRRRAEEEAASLRQAATQEAANLRESASEAAQRVTEDSERYAAQVRADARREADDRIRDAAHRVERLTAAEAQLRQRLYGLETMLQKVRQELDAGHVLGPDEIEGQFDGPFSDDDELEGAGLQPTRELPLGSSPDGDDEEPDDRHDEEPADEEEEEPERSLH